MRDRVQILSQGEEQARTNSQYMGQVINGQEGEGQSFDRKAVIDIFEVY